MAEESEMDDARKRYDFKKTLEKLQSQQGDGTEADHALYTSGQADF